MAEGAVDVHVNASPGEVWGLVNDFGGLADWMPGIDSCRVEGEDRVVSAGGNEVRERLVSSDDATMSLTYAIVGGMPIDGHQATVSVAPEGDGSKVTWTVEVTPDERLPMFTGIYQGALQALAARFG